MQTPRSELNISGSVSDIIGALQNILARSQVIIPVLETPYSRFPNTDHSTVELERQSVINMVAQCQQQLDTVLYELSGLEAVIDSVVSIIAERRQQSDTVLDEISYLEAVMDSVKKLSSASSQKEGEDYTVDEFAQGTPIGSLAPANGSPIPNIQPLSS